MALIAGMLASWAVLLAWPPRPRGPATRAPQSAHAESVVRRFRLAWAVLAAVGCASFLGGLVGWVAGVVVGALVWWLASRSEPPEAAKERRRAARELPHVVLLLAAALRSGADPGRALSLVVAALPGAASARARPVLARLQVGVAPVEVWGELGRDEVLGPLGRTLARASETGAPVADAVEQLAGDLAARSRAEVEDRARAVGVKAAVPLGLCLLPSFLLLGIVPVVAGLLTTVMG